ncbi:GNAT family N-acetyltransferase [Oceanihabitans sediminis]|uniref:GNAT family N-acetyltransferase n=1 Tax=Oceanihabitans sediminis TaxID=1812012 RepID=A0A368P7S9_9FLAO|nr:GNAT family N-acetyltransferase [Oceanihabitans sediminis]MDX1277475.1 GNAT family N-acetyltransferase [Oceanihabitans sediminis]MDX1772816.1 GNAT family N-acetyltransferase [Oceanihabitans sediminis]RBP34494.1 ribosomal protein S18 acetylase RimI-like enzyme [Oceanihabitans sediminis]RCU58164.1 GNAT family N-acetyltransferase [Oceanihabitans sediminis]
MKFFVREAVKEDAKQILDLIVELAVFEKEPNAVELTIEDLEKDGFGENPAFTCFIAATEANEIAGIALIYYRYSTWKGKVIHLEDLIVSEKHRGKGIGTLLLDKVVLYASELGVKRVNWEVLDWNEPAIAFYEKKGANVMRDWNVVQLDEQGIKNYIANI